MTWTAFAILAMFFFLCYKMCWGYIFKWSAPGWHYSDTAERFSLRPPYLGRLGPGPGCKVPHPHPIGYPGLGRIIINITRYWPSLYSSIFMVVCAKISISHLSPCVLMVVWKCSKVIKSDLTWSTVFWIWFMVFRKTQCNVYWESNQNGKVYGMPQYLNCNIQHICYCKI